jgi:hypothetical protein
MRSYIDSELSEDVSISIFTVKKLTIANAKDRQ